MAAEDPISRKAMENAVVSVLKNMAATGAAVMELPAIPPFDRPLIHAHITFDGQCSGELGLLMDHDFAAQIAARILGVDSREPLLQEIILDAGKELLNVMCGQFLTLRFGSDPIFSLGVPRVFPLSAQACNALLSSSPITVFKCGTYLLPAYVRVKDKSV